MRFKPDLDDQLVSFSATVGLVIWPVKIIPEMTYYVSSGTLNLHTHSCCSLSLSPAVREALWALLSLLGILTWTVDKLAD